MHTIDYVLKKDKKLNITLDYKKNSYFYLNYDLFVKAFEDYP